MGGRLAAIAPVSGAPVEPSRIDPATPVSLVTFTGTADPVATPAAEGLDTWRRRASCADPTVRTLDDGAAQIATSVCDDGTDVVWYSITGMGHSWPGDARVAGADVTVPVVATDVMWDFFEQHPRARGAS
jgi:polyhydroxybutyrate depolymerase